MPSALFDKIHDSILYHNRSEPASIEEFIEFGLEPKDFVQYVALQQQLQSKLILHENLISPALDKLVEFCLQKNLIEAFANSVPNHIRYNLQREAAEYSQGWFCYPAEPNDFRLAVERKLSSSWDEENAFITETFGDLHFSFTDYNELPNGDRIILPDSTVHITKYDSEINDFYSLNKIEIMDLIEAVDTQKQQVDQELTDHMAEIPTEHNAENLIKGLPWIKTLRALISKQNMLEELHDKCERALTSIDLLYKNVREALSDSSGPSETAEPPYQLKDSDTLYVVCGSDICKEKGHLLSDMRVELTFYNRPSRLYTLKRCSHCKHFQIPYQELSAIIDVYEVPRGKIVYDYHGDRKLHGFAESSIFYDIGYTVSQSAGLTSAQRQNILRNAIATGKATKQDTLLFLKHRISMNGMKEGNELALRRWKEDYDFVCTLS